MTKLFKCDYLKQTNVHAVFEEGQVRTPAVVFCNSILFYV